MTRVLDHAARALRNAFRSPGYKLFGLRFSRDYLRFAWRVIWHWGSTGPGSLSLLGHRIDYFNQSHALFLIHEVFVNAAYAFESRTPRARIVDCGANIGLAVLFFKAFRPGAAVVAFEPDPVTFARLTRTVEYNGLQNVRLENAAVGDVDGLVPFYSDSSDPGSLTGSTDPSWGGGTRRDVRVVRLSSFLRDPVDLLKLDVEGAEYAVVEDLIATGAIALILEAVIEYHELESRPDGVTGLANSLRNAGFNVTIAAADAAHRTGVLRALRPSSASHA